MRIKVMCKKNINILGYKKGKWYFADFHCHPEYYQRMYGYRTSYWVYNDEKCILGGRYYIEKVEPGDRIFRDYFWTEKELRKMKLERLGKSSLIEPEV